MTIRERNAPYYHAEELLKAGKNQEAFQIYYRLAHEGDASCQVFLGWMLYEGIGTEKDPGEAFEWFKRAAAMGSIRGAFYCGKHLLVQRRYSDAVPYLRTSAASEFSPAVLWLGLLYINGWGVDRNLEKGLQLVKNAAGQGNWMAKRKLASLKISGCCGILGIVEGFMLLPYVIVGGLVSLLIHGNTERLMG